MNKSKKSCAKSHHTGALVMVEKMTNAIADCYGDLMKPGDIFRVSFLITKSDEGRGFRIDEFLINHLGWEQTLARIKKKDKWRKNFTSPCTKLVLHIKPETKS